MKKILTITSFVIIMFMLGCSKEQGFRSPVSFYYPTTQITYGNIDGFISSEQREGADFSLETLIEAYFRGPLENTLQNPFPDDVSLIQCRAEKDSIQLTLSDSYASLSGTQLSVANACIAKTLTEYSGTKTVTISCESKDLDGEKLIIITAADLVLLDQSTGYTTDIPKNTTEAQ